MKILKTIIRLPLLPFSAIFEIMLFMIALITGILLPSLSEKLHIFSDKLPDLNWYFGGKYREVYK